LRADGLAFCWGNNDYGQLGDGTTQSSATPVPVQGGHHFVSLSVAPHEVCGISDGQALCWGSGAAGALGAAAPDQCTPAGGVAVPCSLRPVQVASPEQLLLSSTAGTSGACALTIARIGVCWGLNEDKQFGTAIDDSTQTPTPIPHAVSLGWLASGAGYTCVITQTSVTRCVGSNDVGQLGVGDSENRDTLTTVAGEPPPPLVLVFASNDTSTPPHTCGLTSAGAAWCWGNNQFGQLGATTQTSCSGNVACSTTPLNVTPSVQYSTMSVGGAFTCAVSRGRAFCWGANDMGQLGAGDTAPHAGPVQINLPVPLSDD
jgi:serine/threonine-protein kinase